jgi:hypothetical protein
MTTCVRAKTTRSVVPGPPSVPPELGLEERTHDACNAAATRIECKRSILNSRYSDFERGNPNLVQDLADDKYSCHTGHGPSQCARYLCPLFPHVECRRRPLFAPRVK